MEETPCRCQSPESIHRFLDAVKDFKLTKAEKLQLINLRPTTPVEMQLVSIYYGLVHLIILQEISAVCLNAINVNLLSFEWLYSTVIRTLCIFRLEIIIGLLYFMVLEY